MLLPHTLYIYIKKMNLQVFKVSTNLSDRSCIVLTSIFVFCRLNMYYEEKRVNIKHTYRVWPGVWGECPTAPPVEMTSSPRSWAPCRVSHSLIFFFKLKTRLTYIWVNQHRLIDLVLLSFRWTGRKEEKDYYISSFFRCWLQPIVKASWKKIKQFFANMKNKKQ